jgi:hypothetical protein
MNSDVRDNFNALYANTVGLTFTTVTNPTWTGTGTNPVYGNGSGALHYVTFGNVCLAWYLIYMGSTTTFGTGLWELALPFPINSAFTGRGSALDSSTGALYTGTNMPTGAQRFTLVLSGVYNWVYDTNPFTWASGDFYFGNFIYEI